MKKIKLLLLLVLFGDGLVHSQWKQSKGPGAGLALDMIAVGNDVFVANRDYSVAGKILYRKEMEMFFGTNTVSFSTDHLPQGIHFLKMMKDGTETTLKLMK